MTMLEQMNFHFVGKTADSHRLDFYEASRFQYAAARLAYKLDIFRKTGAIPDRITGKVDTKIQITPHREGSFDIAILAPYLPLINEVGKEFISVPISALLSYVIERIFPTKDDEVAKAAIALASDAVGVLSDQQENEKDKFDQLFDHIKEQQDRLDRERKDKDELYERIIASATRNASLTQHSSQLVKITPEQEKLLIRMASPLFREFEVPLRKSAHSISIRSVANDNSIPILFADSDDLKGVSLEIVDENTSVLQIRIIQYNKETAWGKCRSGEMSSLYSFSVPSDKKMQFNDKIAEGLKNNVLLIEAFIARDSTGKPRRFIVERILSVQEDF